MGHIYAIAGPSGVGKTTFVKHLMATKPANLKLLVRSTSRPPRPNEKEGIDYNYYSNKGFLHKVSSNDFVHEENYMDYFFGIEKTIIENIIFEPGCDGIIIAGIYGSLHLKEIYKDCVTILYLFPGNANSIYNPDCLEGNSPEIKELLWRLNKKHSEQDIEYNDNGSKEYIHRRMQFNYAELAYTLSKLRSKYKIEIFESKQDQKESMVNCFNDLRKKTVRHDQCFVLMPFNDELKPVFEDHIRPTMEKLGFKCFRADGIFSNKPIMDDVIESVKGSYLIISDLTSANPNVFYETGYCHALGKKVILMTQSSDVPFDIKNLRHIKYDYTPRGTKKLEEDLIETVKCIIQG
jgi:guanylate kinase